MVVLISTGFCFTANAAALDDPGPSNYHEKYMGLSTGSKNFQVIPEAMSVSINKYDMTDSYFENYSNHRFASTMHIYEAMSQPQRLLYIMFMHTTYLNDIFFPHIDPSKNKNVSESDLKKDTLINKLETLKVDPYLLESVTDRESALRGLRGHYDFYIRDLFDVKFYAKEGSIFTYQWANKSGLDVKSVKGNLRIIDNKTGILLGDTVVDLAYKKFPHSKLPADHYVDDQKINLPSSMPDWDLVNVTDLAFKFQPISIITSDNKTIDIAELFKYNTNKFVF